MNNQQILERINFLQTDKELSTSERKELASLKEAAKPVKLFQPIKIKPFPCSFCHKPTLQTCRDTRKPNTNNANLINCCKECKDLKNAIDNPYLEVSSIYN